MRILHALHGFPPEHTGGTELYVKRLAETQRDAGHEIVIAAGSYSDAHADFDPIQADGVRLARISQTVMFGERWDHGASPYVESRFAALLEREQPDLVHVHHWIRMSRTLVRRSRAAGLPCVLTAHDLNATCPRIFRVRDDAPFCELPLSVSSCLGCVPRESWMLDDEVAIQIRRFSRDILRELALADAVIAPSREHARVMARFTSFPESRFDVVPHASIFTADVAERPEWRPGCGRRLRVAYWGNLLHFKGPHVLISALASLGRSDEVELVLWGRADDPEYEAELQALCSGLRVERRQQFDHRDLRQLEADLAVVPSLAHESHSFVLDEAFALGIPALVSDRGALAERVERGGLTFAAGDVASLAERLARILDEPDLLCELRSSVQPPLSFPEHAARIDEIYNRVRSTPNECHAAFDEDLVDWESIADAIETRARIQEGHRSAAQGEVDRMRAELARLDGELRESRAALREAEARIDELRRSQSQIQRLLQPRDDAD